MAKPNFRINIPSNPDELIALAQAIMAKHTAVGNSSPLTGLDMAGMKNLTTAAASSNNLSKDLYRQAEKATQDRDVALGQSGQLRESTVRYYVASTRDVLLGLYKGREQSLGDWGFEVDSSARATKTEKPAIP